MLTIKFGRIVQAGIVFVSLWATASNAAAVPLTASVDDQRGASQSFRWRRQRDVEPVCLLGKELDLGPIENAIQSRRTLRVWDFWDRSGAQLQSVRPYNQAIEPAIGLDV